MKQGNREESVTLTRSPTMSRRYSKFLPFVNISNNFILLAGTNALAMGSSFFVFVVVARGGHPTVLGKFALAITISSLLNQLADGGLSQYATREVGQGANLLSVFKWLIRRRLSVLFVSFIPASIFLLASSFSAVQILEVCVLSLLNSFYALGSSYQQSQSHFGLLMLTQLTNAIGFFAAAFLAAFFKKNLDLTTALLIPIAGLLPICLILLSTGLRIASSRQSKHAHSLDKRHFSYTLIANLIISNIGIVVLGARHPLMTAEYAKAMQPAMIFTPISFAVSAILLPRYARMPRGEVILQLKRTFYFLFPVIVLAGLLGAAIGPILDALYKKGHINTIMLVFLFAAYAIGVLTSVLVAGLVSLHRTKMVLYLASLQALVIIIFVLSTVASNNVKLLPIGDFVSRLMGIMFLGIVVYRGFPRPQVEILKARD